MKHKVTLSILAVAAATASALADSPFATEVVSSVALPGTGLYNDPNSVLGKPSTKFNNGSAAAPDIRRVKLIEPAFNVDQDGHKLLTTFNRNAGNPSLNQSVTVKFDHQVLNDANNPFGLDFIVFGNSFFTANGSFTSDATNLNTTNLSGGSFDEPLKISVSPDNVNWYTYDNGPYGDTLMPTNAYKWDRATASWTDQEMDFTKPIDPALTRAVVAGKTAADVLDLYNGSAGGTAFDIAPSGFSFIQYIRVTGVTGFTGGEIDAFSDVAPVSAPVPEPCSLLALGLGAVALVRRRSRA